MKLKFPKKSNGDIIKSIEQAMAGRGLGDLVSLQDEGQSILLKISKLGTSVLTFSRSESSDGVELNLTSEKIAFAHKAFKDDVKQKFGQVITKAGGTILEA